MINCEQASTICNKKQYQEASLLEQIKLSLHLMFCKACSSFSRKNRKLTILCNKADLQILSEQEKIKMKETIERSS
ncbi:hypothetical protein [Eudoraea adriatica]|uniref:hypothetical protein n=1 Tax=Eudoraea adriatica TaxID=446681 RepID=UPI0003737C71|nr:hypothetical protein [Eudoraea adriatica]